MSSRVSRRRARRHHRRTEKRRLQKEPPQGYKAGYGGGGAGGVRVTPSVRTRRKARSRHGKTARHHGERLQRGPRATLDDLPELAAGVNPWEALDRVAV